jgi:hypothetical protein
MKTLKILAAATSLLLGTSFAEDSRPDQKEPTFIGITSDAYEELARLHEKRSEYRTKTVSLIIKNQITNLTADYVGYNIKVEHLDFRVDEAPPDGAKLVRLYKLEFLVTPALMARLEHSTIELMKILSTGRSFVPDALILRPANPIEFEHFNNKKQNKSEQATPRKPSD